MRSIKKKDERKVRISITISNELNEIVENVSKNKSMYIEYALLDYFNKCGLDTSKIKL
jgi:hypothetical protein